MEILAFRNLWLPGGESSRGELPAGDYAHPVLAIIASTLLICCRNCLICWSNCLSCWPRAIAASCWPTSAAFTYLDFLRANCGFRLLNSQWAWLVLAVPNGLDYANQQSNKISPLLLIRVLPASSVFRSSSSSKYFCMMRWFVCNYSYFKKLHTNRDGRCYWVGKEFTWTGVLRSDFWPNEPIEPPFLRCLICSNCSNASYNSRLMLRW